MEDPEGERQSRRARRCISKCARSVRWACDILLSRSSSGQSECRAEEPQSSTTLTQIVHQLGNKQHEVNAVPGGKQCRDSDGDQSHPLWRGTGSLPVRSQAPLRWSLHTPIWSLPVTAGRPGPPAPWEGALPADLSEAEENPQVGFSQHK